MSTGTFDQLSLRDKALIVKEFADPLTSIEYYEDRIFLFSLNGHFVELFQNIETRQIHRITVASYQMMDKYLSRIVLGNVRIGR